MQGRTSSHVRDRQTLIASSSNQEEAEPDVHIDDVPEFDVRQDCYEIAEDAHEQMAHPLELLPQQSKNHQGHLAAIIGETPKEAVIAGVQTESLSLIAVEVSDTSTQLKDAPNLLANASAVTGQFDLGFEGLGACATAMPDGSETCYVTEPLNVPSPARAARRSRTSTGSSRPVRLDERWKQRRLPRVLWAKQK